LKKRRGGGDRSGCSGTSEVGAYAVEEGGKGEGVRSVDGGGAGTGVDVALQQANRGTMLAIASLYVTREERAKRRREPTHFDFTIFLPLDQSSPQIKQAFNLLISSSRISQIGITGFVVFPFASFLVFLKMLAVGSFFRAVPFVTAAAEMEEVPSREELEVEP
jgi:hypothetical protein